MVERRQRPAGARPRLAPEIPFPAYAYVPGRHPHPRRGRRGRAPAGLAPGALHRYALDLFNHGYYWEAHEAWEALWTARGRDSLAGRLYLGLIALAAAGVKVREGTPKGVVRHARRAGAIFRALAAERPVLHGLALAALAARAEAIAARPPSRPAQAEAPPEAVFSGSLG